MKTMIAWVVLLGACATTDAPVDATAEAPTVARPDAADTAQEAQAARTRPQWWHTCGDPVCSGWTEKPGVPDCGPRAVAGDPCRNRGFECDPRSDCNDLMRCARQDPTDGGMCPRSKADQKWGIAYANAAELEDAYRTLLDHKLARWHYNEESPTDKEHFGFLIDDVSGAPSVAGDGEHVDLYGYTSLAVAAIQVQDQRIRQLERELADLKAEIRAQRR